MAIAPAAAWSALYAQGQLWEMATAYPRSTVSGEGIASFAQQINRRSGGALNVTPRFGVADGTTEASTQAKDALSSSLSKIDPIFELPALPLLARTRNDARRLLESARTAYGRSLEKEGLHLLYTTPWPPSGLWSKYPVDRVSDLQKLKVRTYDDTSAEVFRTIGASAISLPMSEALNRVRAGTIDGVLSSGDGEIGSDLAKFLPYFTAISYAVPVSFATVKRSLYAVLDGSTRRVVDQVSRQTEQRQWERLDDRVAENYDRMCSSGVKMQRLVPHEIAEALERGSAPLIKDWQRRIGSRGQHVLRSYALSFASRDA